MDKFFQTCGEVSKQPQLEEMLLHRYSNAIEYILQKPWKEGVEFLRQSLKAQRDERLYSWWCAIVPHMTSDTFISFSDFKDMMTGVNIDERPAEEIFAEVAEIEKRLKNGS